MKGQQNMMKRGRPAVGNCWCCFQESFETSKEDDNRQHRTKGRERTNDGHDGRSLIWTTSVGGCSVGPWHRCHVETVAPTSPRASRAYATRNQWSSARASVLFGPSLVHSEYVVGEARGRSRTVGCDGTFGAHFGQRTGCRVVVPDSRTDGQLNSGRGVKSDSHGIVVGDIIRRLVSRTMAQQIRKKVEKATTPFQYALSTRAGCECIARAIQAMTDANPHCTVLSLNGIGAYDTISRRAMLSGLVRHMEWRQCIAVRAAVLRIPVFLLVGGFRRGGPRSVPG